MSFHLSLRAVLVNLPHGRTDKSKIPSAADDDDPEAAAEARRFRAAGTRDF
jgi:hypothetical protein